MSDIASLLSSCLKYFCLSDKRYGKIIMMSKSFLILFILSIVSTQVRAFQCELNCIVEMDKVEKVSESAHDCCPNSQKEKKEKKNHADCIGEMSGECFHESNTESYSFEREHSKLSHLIFLASGPKLFERNDNYSYRLIIPDDLFIKHKGSRPLFLLKDQFLI